MIVTNWSEASKARVRERGLHGQAGPVVTGPVKSLRYPILSFLAPYAST